MRLKSNKIINRDHHIGVRLWQPKSKKDSISPKLCVVDLAIVLLNFFRYESCSKCNPCRIGNKRAYETPVNISEGVGTLQDLKDLQMMSDRLYEMSNCGLGQTAGSPLKDILAHFRAEVEAHVKLIVCPAGVCLMSSQRV